MQLSTTAARARTYRTPIREQIVDDLCAAISRSGYTHAYIAEKAGCCPSTINRWVMGDTIWPHTRLLVAVARVLGFRLKLVPLDRIH